MITAKIDVTKITKERLYKGEKGTYLKVVLIPTPESQYGDYMIVEEISKEEREAGKRGVILGNAKNIAPAAASTPAIPAKLDRAPEQDDLPF